MADGQVFASHIPGRIESWLENIDTADSLHDESQLVGETKKRSGDCGPVTPHKRLSVHDAVGDPSPTNSSFTGNTIFDSPLAGKGASEGYDITNGFFDDTSDITSIDGNDTCPAPEEQSRKDTEHDRIVSDAQILANDTSFNSIPGRHLKRVRLTSCLQCTLANLPCSCLPPACTRCTRNGNADMCLLQRYKLLEEMKPPSQASDFRVPILLNCATDDSDIYNKKCELAEDLLKKWRSDQDKRNWVLPDLNSGRGRSLGFETEFKLSHPGENLIHRVWAELDIKAD